MKKLRFALFDETGYMNMLAEYLGHKHLLIENRLFTKWELLQEYIQEHTVDVLLLGQEVELYGCDWLDHVGQVVMLTEGNMLKDHGDIPVIFKYQSADVILQEILGVLAENQSLEPVVKKGTESGGTVFWAMFSPYGSWEPDLESYVEEQWNGFEQGAHSPSDGLSEEAPEGALQGKVLILDMEMLSTAPPSQPGMSEVIFYIKQRKDKLIWKLQSLVLREKGFHEVVAVNDYRDLHSLTKDDILFLVDSLRSSGEYSLVLFRIDNLLEEMFYLIQFCDRVFVPKPRGLKEVQKEASLQSLLCGLEYRDKIPRLEYIQNPYEPFAEEAKWG